MEENKNPPSDIAAFEDLITVIIPVYNMKRFLSEALESVMCQSYKNLEIIVVDDGSNDGSGEICDYYATIDSRITVIHEPNKGLSAARNTALDISTGQAIMFLDADDVFLPKTIEILFCAMMKEQADIVAGRSVNCYSNRALKLDYKKKAFKIAPRHNEFNRNEGLQALLRGEITTVVWDKLYKRDLWDNIRFITGHVYEDTPAIAQILKKSNKFYALSDLIHIKRIWNGSITNTNTVANAKDGVSGANWFKDFVESNTPEVFSKEQLQVARQKWFNIIVLWYIRCSLIHNSKEGIALKNALKTIIVKQGKSTSTSISACPSRIKAGYWLACYCPQILGVLMYYYKIFRRFGNGLSATFLC